MAAALPMADGDAADMSGRGRHTEPSLPFILRRLLLSTTQWLGAELAQGRDDAKAVLRSVVKGAVLGVLGLAFLIAGLMMLLEAVATILGNALGSESGGLAITGAGCLVLAGLAVLWARQALRIRTQLHSMITRWLIDKEQPSSN